LDNEGEEHAANSPEENCPWGAMSMCWVGATVAPREGMWKEPSLARVRASWEN